MFVYLSKKISMPNGIRLRSLAWNSQQGWLACGGDSGLVKVLKLPELGATDEKKKEPFTSAQSNLSMNQTLEGHQGSVLVVSWNENYRKLTSSDERGLIIVWILHKGMWFEEMINNRSKCIVLDMRWSSDGQKICILYGDGHVILGDVDGNRLWGKDMNKPLTHVEWSPDGRLLLFCSREGRCNIHDLSGNFLAPLVIHFSNEDLHSSIVGVDWYNGSEGYGDRSAPALAVSLKSGKIQLMRHELDDEPILVDTKMQIISIKWSPNGEVLGVVGLDQSDSMVQLYSHSGNHLRTLSVPGGGISALAWEGRGLRLALAVDAFVYLANIRPDYKWAFFGGNTCVYRFKKKDHDEYSVMFWDIYTGKRYCKYVKSLLSICGQGDHCVLVAMGNDIKQYVLILCNAIGNPIMTKHMTVEPHFLAMNMSFVFVSSENTIFAWNYKSLPQASIGGCESSTSSESDINDSHCFQIDQGKEENGHGKTDEICCICSSEKYLMVGRESGILHRYSLPSLTLESTDLLQCRPQGIELNCNSTQLAVIDLNGVLSFHNLQASFQKEEKMAFDSSECKRKDVWNMKWADDNPDLLAVMEKSRMYIIRGTEPEEPVSCTAYLCKFHDLQIHAVQLDEVMKRPEQVGKEHVFHYETKSLRDTHEILLAVKIQDAFSYVEEHSHPRLWITLAEHALVKLELSIAERAFVKCQNYHGIQFVKGLYSLKDINLQRAEVCFYFKKFDEAEKIYLDMQRMDLAINMRMRLGDWFMVESLVQSGAQTDSLMETLWNNIGNVLFERKDWRQASKYYINARNREKLVECLYAIGDWNGLELVMNDIPDGHKMLLSIGQKFHSVGICEHAVTSFVRGGDVKSAIESCIELNNWDKVAELARKYSYNDFVDEKLKQFTDNLIFSGNHLYAFEVFKQAGEHLKAATVLKDMAAQLAIQRVVIQFLIRHSWCHINA